jgi:hypothetical protein
MLFYASLQGKCCGIESFEDWRNAEFAKDKGHIPDSCCNANYDYRNCGNYAFRHPDLETHRINDLLHAKVTLFDIRIFCNAILYCHC